MYYNNLIILDNSIGEEYCSQDPDVQKTENNIIIKNEGDNLNSKGYKYETCIIKQGFK